MMNRLMKLVAAAALASSALMPAAQAQDKQPIKIGEVNSYTGPLAAFTVTYREGLNLLIKQANANGGVLGRPLEIVYRDDNFSPADAVKMANELVLNQKVDMLAGTYLSPSGLAVAGYADKNKVFFVATEPLANSITWEKGSRYVFRVQNPISQTSRALGLQAGAMSECKNWAGIGPLSEAVTDFFKDFQAVVKEANPNTNWVGGYQSAVGKFDAASTIAQLRRDKVDCVANGHLGPDLVSFVREANARAYMNEAKVVSLQVGFPEWLGSLGSQAPKGWVVSGYSPADIDFPAHKKFVEDYKAEYNKDAGMGAFLGYLSGQAIVAGIQRAGATDTESLIKGFRGADFDCIIGKCHWRKDHQLDLGIWTGTIDVADGKGKMVDVKYVTAADTLPSEEEGLKRRPAGAND
jgi:branched-chain amino acid transport system substrate-binding protein